MHDDLRSAVAADMPRLTKTLANLVRFPSVSAPGFDKGEVLKAANHIVGLLEDAGVENTQLLEVPGGNPAVFGEIPAPEGAPTLLLYAHYDVQPPGPAEEWDTEPFDPVEKDGRLYGRGASDDKAGVVMHLGAVAAHGPDLPVGVQMFFEGEEEAGSESLEAILEKYADLIKPDAIVIGDGGNWAVGVPAYLTSLRGLAAVKLEIRTLASAVHSGQYGGFVPDALMALSRLLASLHDEDGSVAVPGIVSKELEGMDFPEELARAQAGAIDGLELIGTGSIPSRVWSRPSISVLAIDAPSTDEAINQLVPSARAKVSMRIPPGQDATEALQALKDHLTANVPWGSEISFFYEESGEAFTLDIDNHVVDAWTEAFQEAYGKDPVLMGAGGSIPFIATLAERYPEAPILVIGCADPTSAFHAPNESQEIADVEKATLSEAIAFRLLGSR